MKTITALTTAAATLTTSLVAGAVFFGPTASTASFAADTTPGEIHVSVLDHEGDPIENEKVTVLVSDTGGNVVDTEETDADGDVTVDFPTGGVYIVHIDTPPSIYEYDEGGDTDQGATYQCGGKMLTRCITVWVSKGSVHFPDTAAVDLSTPLEMWFRDRSPEPRVEVVVELADHTPVTGGEITIDPDATGKPTLTPENLDGRTRTEEIDTGRYRISYEPPNSHRLVNPNHKTRSEQVSGLLTVTYVVEPIKNQAVEDPGVHIEPADEPSGVGSQPKDRDADDSPVQDAPTPQAPDETIPGETAPADTRPVETAPVDTIPVETIPVETAPPAQDSDTLPVETIPVETAPPAEEPDNAGLVGECFALLETYPTVGEIEPGLFGACESDPGDALTIIDELLAELGI